MMMMMKIMKMKTRVMMVLLSCFLGLVLLIFPTDVSAARFVNVAFPSNATSGNLILHGTIVYPSNDPPSTGYIPAIIIGGSGPGNRWLNTTSALLSTQLVGDLSTL